MGSQLLGGNSSCLGILASNSMIDHLDFLAEWFFGLLVRKISILWLREIILLQMRNQWCRTFILIVLQHTGETCTWIGAG
jgi:hypothetical protein